MTRPRQKAEEQQVFFKVLEILGCNIPRDKVKDGEDPPDLRVDLNGRALGVEVTGYHDNEAALPAKYPRRVVEANWQQFRQQAMEFARPRPEMRGVDVWLSFYPLELPRKCDWDPFLGEIAEFVAQTRHELGPKRIEYSSWATDLVLLGRHLNSISLTVREYPDWHWNGGSGYISTPTDAQMQAVFAAKAGKNYPAGYDELWLIVYGGTAISQMFPMVDDVGELQAKASANLELMNGPFARTILWDPFERVVYEWTRPHGWRRRSPTL